MFNHCKGLTRYQHALRTGDYRTVTHPVCRVRGSHRTSEYRVTVRRSVSGVRGLTRTLTRLSIRWGPRRA